MKDLAMEPAPQQTAEPKMFDPERNPARVLWAAGLFALLWILPLLIQSIFSPHMTFCADALDLSALAVLAAGVYFLCQTGGKRKFIGGVLAFASAVLLAFSAAIARNIKAYAYRIDLAKLLSLRNLYTIGSMRNALFCVAFAVAAALLVRYRMRNRPVKARYTATGGAAAGAYFLANTAMTFLQYRFVLSNFQARNYVVILSGRILDALCLFLVFFAIGSLGSMEHTRVRLRRIGLIWAWLALCAMSVALVASIAIGDELSTRGSFTTQYVLLGAGIAGYALLLFKRRIGLYVILLGAGLLLLAQTLSLLEGAFYGADGYGVLLAGSILGGLNPLFAGLAVRAGTDEANPAAAEHAEQTALEP